MPPKQLFASHSWYGFYWDDSPNFCGCSVLTGLLGLFTVSLFLCGKMPSHWTSSPHRVGVCSKSFQCKSPALKALVH